MINLTVTIKKLPSLGFSQVKSLLLTLTKLDYLALATGAILPFAFSPFNFFIIAFFAPALLLFSWLHTTPSLAFRRGFLFGIGFFGIGISWVFISIHVFGGASISLAIFITAFFVTYLSLFPALQGFYLTKYFRYNNKIKLLLAFPITWVAADMLRGWLFTGFPWLLLGYTQTNSWLNGYAPLFGVYGLTFITAFCNALLFIIIDKTRKNPRAPMLTILTLFGVFVIGYWLSTINWTQPQGPRQQTTLIQGNIQQELKWKPEQIIETLQLYTRHTQENWSSDLIIWPEAAITIPLHQASDFLYELGLLAKGHHTTIITGIPIVTPNVAFNGLVAIGNGRGVYHKRHLVPFGEYIPLKPLWGFVMKAFDIPMSNSQPGKKLQQPIMANGIAIAPYICYEIAYPLEFLAFLPKAQLLLTITDDSWFGHSMAAMQHLQMAQLRAIETGRYLLFSSNTGVTAVINAKGNITQDIPSFQEAELTTTVQPMVGTTPWMILKTYPLFGLMLLTLILARKQASRKNVER